MKLYKERPVLTSQFDVSKLQKQLRNVTLIHLDQSANFGPLSTGVRDNKSQHKSLKVTRNATNGDKHINEASSQIFANNLFKISCKYTQDMLSNWKICFIVINIRSYDEFLCNLNKSNETV